MPGRELPIPSPSANLAGSWKRYLRTRTQPNPGSFPRRPHVPAGRALPLRPSTGLPFCPPSPRDRGTRGPKPMVNYVSAIVFVALLLPGLALAAAADAPGRAILIVAPWILVSLY